MTETPRSNGGVTIQANENGMIQVGIFDELDVESFAVLSVEQALRVGQALTLLALKMGVRARRAGQGEGVRVQ